MSKVKLDWVLFEKAAAAVKQAAPPHIIPEITAGSYTTPEQARSWLRRRFTGEGIDESIGRGIQSLFEQHMRKGFREREYGPGFPADAEGGIPQGKDYLSGLRPDFRSSYSPRYRELPDGSLPRDPLEPILGAGRAMK